MHALGIQLALFVLIVFDQQMLVYFVSQYNVHWSYIILMCSSMYAFPEKFGVHRNVAPFDMHADCQCSKYSILT